MAFLTLRLSNLLTTRLVSLCLYNISFKTLQNFRFLTHLENFRTCNKEIYKSH